MPQLDGFPIGEPLLGGPSHKFAKQRSVSPLRVFGLPALMAQVLEEIFDESLHEPIASRRSTARTLPHIWRWSWRRPQAGAAAPAAFCSNRASPDNPARIACRNWAGFCPARIGRPARSGRNPALALHQSGSIYRPADRTRIWYRR